jgi:hypothetical protein
MKPVMKPRLILLAALIALFASTVAQSAHWTVIAGFAFGWSILAILITAPAMARTLTARLGDLASAVLLLSIIFNSRD